jgi:hypothetical protein
MAERRWRAMQINGTRRLTELFRFIGPILIPSPPQIKRHPLLITKN